MASGYTGVIQYIGQWRVVIQELYSIVGSGQWLYRSYTVYSPVESGYTGVIQYRGKWLVVIQELYSKVDSGPWIYRSYTV